MKAAYLLSGTGGRWALVGSWVASVISLGAVEVFAFGATIPLRLVLFAAVGTAFVALWVNWVRWLHATARSSLWVLLGLIPWLNIVVLVGSLFLRRRVVDDDRFAPGPRYLVGIVPILLMGLIFCTRAFWEPFSIVSGSMEPTLETGDYVVATIGATSLMQGDVVVFRPDTDHETSFAHRIVALGGQSVQMRGGVLYVDRLPVALEAREPYEQVKEATGPLNLIPRCGNDPVVSGGACITPRATETFANGQAHDILDIGESSFDDTPEVMVPKDHVFVMGDNRDNARDSRMAPTIGGIGTVPESAMHARVRAVVFNTETWRFGWKSVQ